MHFAFQPVVSTHTGQAIAWEALLRGWERLGFDSIPQVFDRAHGDGTVLEVNAWLLDRAIELFLQARECCADDPQGSLIRLYFNIDNRVFESDHAADTLLEVVTAAGIHPNRVTVEISELRALPEAAQREHQLPTLRSRGVQVALDDFGAGYSGLQMLYEAGSDIIKMDRFFVSGIDQDPTKRIFVTNLVSIAHAMGLHVVAEGVESETEYYVCREIGCDSIQGYLIARPVDRYAMLRTNYPAVEAMVREDRRRTTASGRLLKERINPIKPIALGTPILDVLRRFRTDREASFLPVVNEVNEPVGILREHDLKEYVYSPYGISLLMNQTYGEEPYRYIRRVPVAPAHSRLDRILELAAMETVAEALIITENGQYLGCLDSRTLLQILHEQELVSARDQNPLTRLPGNTLIAERMTEAMQPDEQATIVAYFDFDNFKPFNDSYGFRIGDRVIQMFADLLRRDWLTSFDFAGHVGGDDFVLIMNRPPAQIDEALDSIRETITFFTQDVRVFYDPADIAAGGITAPDRSGRIRTFPLLSASAAVLVVPPRSFAVSTIAVTRHLSLLKNFAKRSSGVPTIATLIAERLRDTPRDD